MKQKVDWHTSKQAHRLLNIKPGEEGMGKEQIFQLFWNLVNVYKERNTLETSKVKTTLAMVIL